MEEAEKPDGEVGLFDQCGLGRESLGYGGVSIYG